jgi:hypothetical protein
MTASVAGNRKGLLHRLLICISLIWLGMILGISFLEAPLKFKAPGVTLEIGLGIGRLVFGAFNKVECAMALAMAILAVIARQKGRLLIPLAVVWVFLALQTFWLLPVLDGRVELILRGQTPAPSRLHAIYVILETLKAAALAVYGLMAFRERSSNSTI